MKRILTSQDSFLMIDKSIILEQKGLSLSMCQAVKCPENPVIPHGGSGEADEWRAASAKVFRENGKFKAYYTGYKNSQRPPWGRWSWPAYAESEDGIHWQKPNMGLVEYNGNKDNNLIPPEFRITGILDPNETDPNKRYKKVYGGTLEIEHFTKEEIKEMERGGGREKIQLVELRRPDGQPCSAWGVMYSPDGRHWTKDNRKTPMIRAKIEGAWLRYFQGKYYIIGQQLYPWIDLPGKGRVRAMYVSEDLEHWKQLHSPQYQIPEKLGAAGYQIHSMHRWDRGNVIIGFPGLFLHYGPEIYASQVDIGIAISDNFLQFHQPAPGFCIIRRGGWGDWDGGFIFCVSSVLNVDNKTYIYYTAGNTGNNDDNYFSTGLATIGLDRFGYRGLHVGWDFPSFKGVRKGHLTTVPIKLVDKKTEHLYLNVGNLRNDPEAAEHFLMVANEKDPGKSRYLKVELLDENKRPILGYTIDDADAIRDSGIKVKATWRGKPGLAGISGDTIHVKIYFFGGQRHQHSPFLYALYFSK